LLVLKSRRFCLREFTDADRAAFLACHANPQFAAHHESSELQLDHLGAVFDLFLGWRDERSRRNFQFVIAPLGDPDHYIGNVGVRTEGLPPGHGELGIELVPSWWRRGAATEVMGIVVPWARRVHGVGVHTAATVPGNTGAERLARNAGLQVIEDSRKTRWRTPSRS
jgi:RimJ/RimL family protein N-acetyltransferase